MTMSLLGRNNVIITLLRKHKVEITLNIKKASIKVPYTKTYTQFNVITVTKMPVRGKSKITYRQRNAV